ncbi:hypothetical protein [uncultured Treponema sp.]|uniref:hypothetical protein n=1 Tax=uncultured Treponema sp. TaxID=162155 RepID=UPI0025D1D069|nr:hypothetical protein [uncultured Treponema sp.]
MKLIYITDEWKKHGLKEGVQFATLTDIIYKTWAGKTAKEYKEFKGLKKGKSSGQYDKQGTCPEYAC